LGPDVSAAHAIWLTDADIELLKKTGTSVVHNPECNMKIASGIAPIARMLKAGVNVALGTDSCAVNDNTDLFEAMRIFVMLQRVANLDSTIVSSYEALEMATIGGARSLGLEKKLGSLEPGKLADIILVDLKAANMRPVNNIINNLVYCANSGNVETVIVNGNLIMEKGTILTVNEEEALDEAEAYAQKRFQEAGLAVPSYYLTSLGEDF
jgi:5-methylthioadenosine/S-adenosylhomocysteine deaminase